MPHETGAQVGARAEVDPAIGRNQLHEVFDRHFDLLCDPRCEVPPMMGRFPVALRGHCS